MAQIAVTELLLRKYIGSGKYPTAKWILFCQELLTRGYKLSLCDSKSTVSKYITVHGINDDYFKVRFSNHRPRIRDEVIGDSDFYVGVTNFKVSTWEDALRAVYRHFGATCYVSKNLRKTA